MRKRILALLLLMTVLTGCSPSPSSLMPFEESNFHSEETLLDIQNMDAADLFAQNLAVIPAGFNSARDGNLTAASSLLVDVTDRKVLFTSNAFERMYPASITKIVTAMVTLKYGNLTDVVKVSHKAGNITEPGAKLCGLKEGDQIILKDLLTALLVYSGNDAGIAIAEHIAGSEEAFAELMNEEVRKLGAVDSHFVNPHGLHDDNHYTTAYDLYLIFQDLLSNEEFLGMIHNATYTLHYKDSQGNAVTKEYESTDRFLTGQSKVPDGMVILGGKTGTTSNAGSCLILGSTGSNGHTYISIVLKASTGDDLFAQMGYLLRMAAKSQN